MFYRLKSVAVGIRTPNFPLAGFFFEMSGNCMNRPLYDFIAHLHSIDEILS